ncbi:MAG: hypothetical protein WBG50_18005 [Desulfomonilaceae bacterium]
MKRDEYMWECTCGNRLSVSAERVKSGLEICPRCGVVIGSTCGNSCAPSVADTQTINIREMARMAQEGIDVEVSGEWDTSDSCTQAQTKPGDDSE